MRSGLTDTSPEAQQVLTETYRRMPAWRKWRQLGELYALARQFHAAGLRLRQPAATPRDVLCDWLQNQLHLSPLPLIPEVVVDPLPAHLIGLEDLRKVLQALNRLGIPYALGGSIASSVYGESRFTQDADIVVPPFAGQEAALAASFDAGFYLSVPAMEEANRWRGSFNIINTLTGYKVDVFILKDDPFEAEAFARRRPIAVGPPSADPVVLHSPEDAILFKLVWYRLGGEVANNQWRDVLGVLRTQAGRLDEAYLNRWAAHLRVDDLLQAARGEVTP